MKAQTPIPWLRLGLLALTGVTLLTARPVAQATPTQRGFSPNLVERLERDGRFGTLLIALELTGLKGVVATGGTFTVFAPTDEAFAKLPPGTIEALIADPPALAQILLYHVVNGRQYAVKLLQTNTPVSLQGKPLLVLRERLKVFVNGNRVIKADVPAANGLIHVIDGVLLPPEAPASINSLVDVLVLDGRFNTLIAAVQAAGLSDALTTGGPFTLFAPTDEAFAALPPGTVEGLLADPDALRSVLLYHVLGQRSKALRLLAGRTATTLQGGDVSFKIRGADFYVNQARVLHSDIHSPNGLIHVINQVLLPPAPAPNLLQVLQNDGRFGTLLAALQTAGLDSVIANNGPFTIFAPTDAAFAALPPGTVQALLADVDALTEVLLYHVVSGDQTTAQLLRQRRVQTLQGDKVTVYGWLGKVYVNRSQVIQANVDATNGKVHVINRVLLPPTN